MPFPPAAEAALPAANGFHCCCTDGAAEFVAPIGWGAVLPAPAVELKKSVANPALFVSIAAGGAGAGAEPTPGKDANKSAPPLAPEDGVVEDGTAPPIANGSTIGAAGVVAPLPPNRSSRSIIPLPLLLLLLLLFAISTM